MSLGAGNFFILALTGADQSALRDCSYTAVPTPVLEVIDVQCDEKKFSFKSVRPDGEVLVDGKVLQSVERKDALIATFLKGG